MNLFWIRENQKQNIIIVVSYVELKVQILGSTITQNNYIKQNNKYCVQGSQWIFFRMRENQKQNIIFYGILCRTESTNSGINNYIKQNNEYCVQGSPWIFFRIRENQK
jgi:hypothetical protein